MIVGLVLGALTGALFALLKGLRIWKLAAALGIAGAVLGAAAALAIPVRYSSTATVAYNGVFATTDHVDQVIATVLTNSSLDEMVRKFKLYPHDPAARDKMRAHLHIQRIGPTAG